MDRRSLSMKHRNAIYDAQEGRCHVCGSHMSRARFEIDHVQALIHGGDDAADNLRGCCVTCHAAKTLRDVQGLKKANRIAVGGKKRSGPKMKSAGFPKGLVVTLPNGMTVRHTEGCSCERCKNYPETA